MSGRVLPFEDGLGDAEGFNEVGDRVEVQVEVLGVWGCVYVEESKGFDSGSEEERKFSSRVISCVSRQGLVLVLQELLKGDEEVDMGLVFCVVSGSGDGVDFSEVVVGAPGQG